MRKTILFTIAALIALIAVYVAGCGSSDGPLGSKPDMTGVITAIEPNGGNGISGTILVEAEYVSEEYTGTDKYVVTVKDDTMLFEQDGETTESITFDMLRAGQQARVWFSGPVRESYPAQVDARQVIVTNPTPGQEAGLGEEFTLAPGEIASITGEDLLIRFVGVTGDSRCPTGATCVWEGEVTADIEIIDRFSTNTVTLTQPGLTDQYATETFGEYVLSFTVEPYPELGKDIAAEEYRLILVVSR